ncbi:MAG: hypothetical protein KTR24_01665 [Saprospiraceae bacterium]|nr:hypothetical protein [Saprospiraceae bacterium]
MDSDLSLPQTLSEAQEEKVLVHLTQRVEHLLATDKEALLSMFYRLDINEGEVREALLEHANPALQLATLILARHQKRLETKAKYQQEPISGFEF